MEGRIRGIVEFFQQFILFFAYVAAALVLACCGISPGAGWGWLWQVCRATNGDPCLWPQPCLQTQKKAPRREGEPGGAGVKKGCQILPHFLQCWAGGGLC